MTFSPGARLGPHEIIGALGAGGMGEVFRARDTKLNRDVAIKVLPAAFADDPERLARFTREAQTLASLNHPNIAAIYGIEEVASSAASDGLVAMTKGAGATKGAHSAGSTIALVMELVEGEDLSVHIARGPIPIAEALEAAHEQGIVHRDLTGKRAFEGDDVSETLASVLKDALSMDALPIDVPPRLKRVIERCLDRDLKTRLRDIGEARIEIARIEAAGPDSADPASTIVPAAAMAQDQAWRPPAWKRAVPWAWATVSTVALLAGLFTWAPWRPTPVPTPRKLLASIGADASLAGFGAAPILSPDGTTLGLTARQAGQSRLFVRKLDQLQAGDGVRGRAAWAAATMQSGNQCDK